MDYAFTLNFDDGAELKFESPFEVGWPDGGRSKVDPEAQKGLVGSLLVLHLAEVEKARVDGDEINVTFSNGFTLIGRSDPAYEAWTYAQSDPTELLLVAIPGGGVGKWGDFRDRSN